MHTGDLSVAERLLTLVYGELHRLAWLNLSSSIQFWSRAACVVR
jgi:hypothetical protein